MNAIIIDNKFNNKLLNILIYISMNCPICLSLCVFPIELKCKHILCYLCLKGITNHSNKCPLCRHVFDFY